LDSEFLGFSVQAAAQHRPYGPFSGGGESVIMTLIVVGVGVVVIGGFLYAIIADALDHWRETLALLVFAGIVLVVYVFVGLGFWLSVVSLIAVLSALMLCGAIWLKLRGEEPQGDLWLFLVLTCAFGGGAYWLST
jgi:hypothetical protein